MAWKRLVRPVFAVVASGGLGAAALIAAAGPAAAASYGPGAEYQVEISSNIHDLANFGNGTGGGIWIWAALNSDGSVDYEEADCVHNFPFAPNGSRHNTSGTATWSESNGELKISGVKTALGPVNITVPATDGHYMYMANNDLFSSPVFSALPAQVQVAP